MYTVHCFGTPTHFKSSLPFNIGGWVVVVLKQGFFGGEGSYDITELIELFFEP